MHRRFRTAGIVIALITATVGLSGCGVLEPTRDRDGAITKPTVMPTIDAWVGDCFSFVDNSAFAYVTVVPCATEHSNIVMGRGTFSERRLELAGGAEGAVLAACKVIYEEYRAADASRGKPEHQSIIGTSSRAGVTTTHYSCVAEHAAGPTRD